MTKGELVELVKDFPDNAVVLVVVPRFDMPDPLPGLPTFDWALDSVHLKEVAPGSPILELRTPGTAEDFE